MKSSSTKEILGIDTETYRKWTEWHFTPQMNWSNIEIEHVRTICSFDTSKDEQLKGAFSWRNSQPLSKKDHQQKAIKFNLLDYQLQFTEANQFIKLKEGGLNQNIH